MLLNCKYKKHIIVLKYSQLIFIMYIKYKAFIYKTSWFVSIIKCVLYIYFI